MFPKLSGIVLGSQTHITVTIQGFCRFQQVKLRLFKTIMNKIKDLLHVHIGKK